MIMVYNVKDPDIHPSQDLRKRESKAQRSPTTEYFGTDPRPSLRIRRSRDQEIKGSKDLGLVN